MKITDMISDAAARAKETATESINDAVWAARKPVEVTARTAAKYAEHAAKDAGCALIASALMPPLGPVAVGLHLLTLPSVLKHQWEMSEAEAELARLERIEK